MKIIVVSVALPKEAAGEFGIQGQLFLNKLIKGIRATISDVKALTIANVPITYEQIQQIYKNDSLEYNIISGKNNFVKILRKSLLYFRTFYREGSDRNISIIVDGLNVKCLIVSIFIKILYHVKLYTVLTDIPRFVIKNKLSLFLTEKLAKLSSGYIFLTKEMNDLVNKKGRPYCIIEGFVNIEIVNPEPQKIANSKVILYAGGVSKLYGLDNLVNGFIRLKNREIELHIYGNGDYVDAVKQVSKKHPNVKYMGVVNNDKMIRLEQDAYFLVNPRPVSDLYTIYSFPSKTLEYLASATPVITTRLRCIPSEYDQYLNYFISDDSKGIASTLEKLVSIPYDELKKKAVCGCEFVRENKNNTVLCKKIIRMISNK